MKLGGCGHDKVMQGHPSKRLPSLRAGRSTSAHTGHFSKGSPSTPSTPSSARSDAPLATLTYSM